MTRREKMQKIIDQGDFTILHYYAFGYPCACMGTRDGEPECFCKMNTNQIGEHFSLAALRRGKLVRLVPRT